MTIKIEENEVENDLYRSYTDISKPYQHSPYEESKQLFIFTDSHQPDVAEGLFDNENDPLSLSIKREKKVKYIRTLSRHQVKEASKVAKLRSPLNPINPYNGIDTSSQALKQKEEELKLIQYKIKNPPKNNSDQKLSNDQSGFSQ